MTRGQESTRESEQGTQDPLLSGLNAVQGEAVLYGDGPLLVLAGAGSGKTRLLTRRLAHLILRRGVSPERILAVTFTNKAADEMRRRVEGLLGFGAEGLWIGTFHSICLRLLRRHGDRLGFTGPITVFDDDDQSSLLKEVLKAHNQDPDAPRVREVKNVLSMAKNRLWGPDELASEWMHRDAARYAELYRAYQSRLRAQNGADFDDLLALAVKLLEDQPEVGDLYARKFLQVLVDEYQDTNHAQFRLVKRLTATHGNVMVVGDDDQSIYRWRGADITNILEFERHFPRAHAVHLVQNYRSTKNILAVAQAVVEKNEGRRDKNLFTENEQGEPVVLTLAEDEEEEARNLVLRVRDGIRDGRWTAGDVAVLYRVHAQSRPIEEACLTHGLDYLIVGGVAFYQRREVKDLVAYLKLAMNPRDEVSFRRVLGAPKRGIGDTGRERIEGKAMAWGGDLIRALVSLDASSGLRDAQRKKAAELGHLLEEMRTRHGEGPETLLKLVVERTAYEDWLKETEGSEFEERRANVQELLAGAARFEHVRGPGSLQDYLDQVALYTNLDRGQLGGDRITLMTVHNAKGLEFPVVWIAGLEEGLFPHSSSLDDAAEMEEERRLFYVAATRAMRALHISASMARRRMNRFSEGGPSRFLSDLPRDRLREVPPAGGGRRIAFDPRPRWRVRETVDFAEDTDTEQAVDLFVPDEIRAAPAPDWRGRRVEHRVFGIGRVEAAEGVGPEAHLSIEFPGFGRKRIVARFVTPI